MRDRPWDAVIEVSWQPGLVRGALAAAGERAARDPEGPMFWLLGHGVAQKILELTVREALALNDPQVGIEHITLALTAIRSGLVPPILSAAGTSAPTLRAAILGRYRQAS